ncbi:unnamed protein product [Ectocarpus sp. 6 AP-2014]
MSALEGQQWYIEEIPPVEDNGELGDVVCEPSVTVESEPVDSAQKAVIALDIGSAATLDTQQQSKVGKPASVASTGAVAHSPVGGIGDRSSRGETWVCKTIAASSSTQQPSPRGGCSWTKVGSKFVLFGGADERQQHFSDIHCFDAAIGKWEKTPVSGAPPSPRNGHSAVALGESLVVYGGMNGQDGVTFNDLFELRPGSTEGMEWVPLPCVDIPPRNAHTAVLDGETMIVIAGASPEGQTDNVFTIDLSDRANLACRRVFCQPFESGTGERRCSEGVGGIPAAREMHSTCAYNSEGTTGERATTILLMGGRSAGGVLRDLFALRTDTWTWKRLKDAPVARCAHSACFVQAAGIMAIYGGWDGGTTVADDLHLYDVGCGEWTKPRISPTTAGRFAHAACAVGLEGEMIVFGGVHPGQDLDDVLLLSAA